MNQNAKKIKIILLKKLFFEWGLIVLLPMILIINIGQFIYKDQMNNQIDFAKSVYIEDNISQQIIIEFQEEKHKSIKASVKDIENILDIVGLNYFEAKENIIKIEISSNQLDVLEEAFVKLQKLGQVMLTNTDYQDNVYYWTLEVNL